MDSNIYKTPIGNILISSDKEAITTLKLVGASIARPPMDGLDPSAVEASHHPTTLTDLAAKQLLEYLDGKRQEFTIPLAPKGTVFQQAVWDALLSIPYGETRSYKQVAQMINNPKAVRAVGMANNKNPIWIIIPCHRVIGSNGKLVGYGGGLDIKEKLLLLEKSHY